QQVFRFDIQVLQREILAHVIQRIGRVAQITQQFVARDANRARLLDLLETVLETHVGQLGDDDELALYDLESFQGEQEGVANLLDSVERLELPSRPLVVEVSVYELDRLGQAAGRLNAPDFSIAAYADT